MGCISHWHADFCSILFIQLSLYKSCHYGYGCCHKSVITKWTYCVNMWDMAHVLCFLMTLAFCLFEILVKSFTQQFTLKSWYELFCRICLSILHGVSLTNLWNVHVFEFSLGCTFSKYINWTTNSVGIRTVVEINVQIFCTQEYTQTRSVNYSKW